MSAPEWTKDGLMQTKTDTHHAATSAGRDDGAGSIARSDQYLLLCAALPVTRTDVFVRAGLIDPRYRG